MVNPRMRRLVGGLVAACGIVLSSFAVGLGGASAVPPGIPDQEEPPGAEAQTTSTVRMRERCIWYVDGVPASINLLPTGDDVVFDGDGDPIGKVYDGSEYSLSVDLPELRAWNSGNESGGGAEFVEEHAFCTYFGATTGIAITGTWSEGGFTATAFPSGRDDNLDFGMTSVNPLAMTIDKGTCRTPSLGPDESAWQFGGGPFAEDGDWWTLTKDEVTSALGGRLMEQPKGVTTDRPANAPSGNDRCGVNLSVQVSIPEGGRPRYAGEAYTFSGPTFTTEIVIDSGSE
jgi:hypothetical protein